MGPPLIIGDTETCCPICNGKLIREKKKGQIIKTCPSGHKFIVKHPILGKEEK